jgi:hypothetical protein
MMRVKKRDIRISRSSADDDFCLLVYDAMQNDSSWFM